MGGGSHIVYFIAHMAKGGSPTVYIAVHCIHYHGWFSYNENSCTLHTLPWGFGVHWCTNGIMVSTGTVYIVQYCSNVHIAAFLLDHTKLLTSSNATVSGCPVKMYVYYRA